MRLTRYLKTLVAMYKQNVAFEKVVGGCSDLVVFCVPEIELINGGVLSIFSLARYSRKFKDSVVIVTLPSKYTYYRNKKFINQEIIFRFSQVIDIADRLNSLIIHIPEYAVKTWLTKLSFPARRALKKIKKLQINIMNQNVEMMPQVADILPLKRICDNVTQTVAHVSCANQSICNMTQIPTHLFSTYLDLSKYSRVKFINKKRRIVFSPDKSEYKQVIKKAIIKYFLDIEVITVRNMAFEDYIRLVAESLAVITFGEGFDGYFLQACEMGTLGIAIYNDIFFPDKSWLDLPNVYESFEALLRGIGMHFEGLIFDADRYYRACSSVVEKNNTSNSESNYIDNIRRFYDQKYDFYPEKI